MKSIIFNAAAALLVGFAVVANAQNSNEDWPCEVKKCSKKNPDFNNCLVSHANRALPYIFKGDPSLGIQNHRPFSANNLNFGANQTFKLHYDEANIYGIDHVHVSNMSWDFENRHINIDFLFFATIYLQGPYRSKGNFEGLDITGKGLLNLICVGGDEGTKLTYSMNYDVMKVRGKEYIQIKNRECTREGGFRLQFTNELKTQQQVASDMVALNKKSVAVDKAIDPEMREIVCTVVDYALNPFFINFPMSTFFN